MTDITPPPELVQQWLEELYGGPVSVISPFDQRVLIAAAQWGADQELEACCALLELSDDNARDFLYSARRPKPPSLKEQAIEALDDAVMRGDCITVSDALPTIRRALEALPE